MASVSAAEKSRLSMESVVEIMEFANTEEFQAVLKELYSEPYEERDEYVRKVLLDPQQLATRSVTVPEGMTIQRSRFHDGRPTIFCISKMVKGNLRKVTITFDKEPAGQQPELAASHG
jgi:hypothetical protein